MQKFITKEGALFFQNYHYTTRNYPNMKDDLKVKTSSNHFYKEKGKKTKHVETNWPQKWLR